MPVSSHSIEKISTPDAPAAIGPYSQGVRAGDLLFVSGQIPLDPKSGELVSGTIEAKAHRMILNVQAVVQAAGGTLANVVKTTLFFQDLGNFQKVNAVYAEYFGSHMPARAAVQAAALPKGAELEMEAIAYLPGIITRP